MGFFKDVRQLQKQSHEIDKNWDPGQQMRDAKSRMAQATANMAAMTSTGNLLSTGQAARGSVTQVEDMGMQVNMQPVLRIHVLVTPDSGAPFPAISEAPVSPAFLARVSPGAQLGVRYDPANPAVVAVDWTVV